MADFSKFKVDDVSYDVKDSKARQSVANLENKAVTVSYESDSETIVIKKGGDL